MRRGKGTGKAVPADLSQRLRPLDATSRQAVLPLYEIESPDAQCQIYLSEGRVRQRDHGVDRFARVSAPWQACRRAGVQAFIYRSLVDCRRAFLGKALVLRDKERRGDVSPKAVLDAGVGTCRNPAGPRAEIRQLYTRDRAGREIFLRIAFPPSFSLTLVKGMFGLSSNRQQDLQHKIVYSEEAQP